MRIFQSRSELDYVTMLMKAFRDGKVKLDVCCQATCSSSVQYVPETARRTLDFVQVLMIELPPHGSGIAEVRGPAEHWAWLPV